MERSIARIINAVAALLALLAWLAGIVLAQPGWWKAGATFVPPLAWYLLAERLMKVMGLVS